jgi:hypothetical protein
MINLNPLYRQPEPHRGVLPLRSWRLPLVLGHMWMSSSFETFAQPHMLVSQPRLGYSHEFFHELIASAGADTTVSAITSFVLAMVHEPDVQRHAQEELERVCPGRLPDFSDRPALPFIDYIVWEALRWNPVTPVGVCNLPHHFITKF